MSAAHFIPLLSIISGTGIAIWLKTDFGPTGHHYPQSSPLLCICLFPEFPPFIKCALEGTFCEGVHRLWFCLDHLNCVKMSVSSIRETKKVAGGRVGWAGDGSHVFLVKTSLMKKEIWDGALSWCNSQFLCCQSLRRSLHTFSYSHCKS
jgi:hypothetical protein